MRIVSEDFFKQFKCIAGECPCTCCSGWQIMIDDASLEKYENYDGKIKANVNNSIDWLEGSFLQCENGDCAFLNENKLCDLILAEGDGMLCDTCRNYPRHVEEYEDLREWSMSLSCPEVAHIINSLDTFSLDITDNDEEDPLEDEFEDFDLILFDKLLESREVMFKILRDRSFALKVRVGLCLELAGRLQELYDSDETFMMDDVIEEFKDAKALKAMAEECEVSFAGYIRNDFKVFDELERLSDDFDDFISVIESYPYSEADNEKQREVALENILVSLLYTYYLGAIYNGMITAYTEMCVFIMVVVDALSLAKSEKYGRALTDKEFEEVIYRVSREIEHSDININTILEYFDLQA